MRTIHKFCVIVYLIVHQRFLILLILINDLTINADLIRAAGYQSFDKYEI